MASLAIVSAVQHPAAFGSISGNSLKGTMLPVKQPHGNLKLNNSRRGSVIAKYGEKSVYFDLEDLGNTTGNWDLYGSDAPSPYHPLQSKFFETFAAPFTKRELLLKFLLLGGGFTFVYLSATAPPDILPMNRRSGLPAKPGPSGKM